MSTVRRALITGITGQDGSYLAALKECALACRVYFAGSSEMFGKVTTIPQDEQTQFHPRSAYGISKVAGFHLTRNYREAYGLRAWCGILYNHESPRRGFEFVTRKITFQAARIKLDLAHELPLGISRRGGTGATPGNTSRPCGACCKQETPDDYVIATGETHAVREFAEAAFAHLGLDYRDYVRVDPALVRPAEVELPLGCAAKAERELGWRPGTTFRDLVVEMV